MLMKLKDKSFFFLITTLICICIYVAFVLIHPVGQSMILFYLPIVSIIGIIVSIKQFVIGEVKIFALISFFLNLFWFLYFAYIIYTIFKYE